ncbi:MAG: tripartite tricarboxylate transporter TctB family protein [Thermodesulfobacteriota bacterium]|nr:tripartite tricarboxylate transporter TctB family protein [Thermodesulfobacteriota bacterium]
MNPENPTQQRPDPKEENMAVTDFLSGIFLMGFSLVIILWALKMPRFSGWSSAPGLLPLLLCTSTFFMSLSLLITSIRMQGHKKFMMRIRAFSFGRLIGETKTRRSLGIIFLTAIYIFILLHRMPFELASFLYLFATFSIFWKKGGWLKIVLISLLLPFVTSVLFRGLFVVFLPGGTFFEELIKLLR